MRVFRSGQTELAVNQLALPTVVRIHLRALRLGRSVARGLVTVRLDRRCPNLPDASLALHVVAPIGREERRVIGHGPGFQPGSHFDSQDLSDFPRTLKVKASLLVDQWWNWYTRPAYIRVHCGFEPRLIRRRSSRGFGLVMLWSQQEFITLLESVQIGHG